MKRAVRVIAVLVVLAGLAASAVVLRAYVAMSSARPLLQRGDWKAARGLLRRYLDVFSGDAQARMLLAEALIKDEALPEHERVWEAVVHLRTVPDDSAFGPDARVREARLLFLVLHQPGAAEQVLHQALQRQPGSYEAHYLLWRLFDMTGRTDLSEPYFWGAYANAPRHERAVRLREWYMSQFAPLTSNAELDRSMGFLGPTELPSAPAELTRLNAFRRQEATSATAHASVARWYLRQGEPRRALTVLQQAQALPSAAGDAFFIATRVAVAIELGQFDEAEQHFAAWPPPHEGHEYWKWKGIIAEEVRRDDRAAVAAYDTAISVWPGHVDWSLPFRKAHCLARLGRHDEAAATRKAAQAVEQLMVPDVHMELRTALQHLDRPQELERIVEFYHALGRTREANCWRDHIQDLQTRTNEVPR